MSTLMAPQLVSFRTVVLVLSLTSLTAAQKQPVQQQEYTTSTTKQSQRDWWKPSLLLWTQNQKNIMTVFLTEVLQALSNNNLSHQAKALQLFSNNCRWTLHWIPAHFGALENQQADKLAKKGAQTEQPGANVSYQENAYTIKHIIQNCKRHDQERSASWPTELTLNQKNLKKKLHGDEENPRRTTTCILAISLIVWQPPKRRRYRSYVPCSFLRYTCKRQKLPCIIFYDDNNGKNPVHQWIRMLLFHSLVLFKVFYEM